MWKTTKVQPAGLRDVPEAPEELIYIWDWFKDVFSGQRLTYTELRNWSDLMGIRAQGWEIEAIRSLDRIFWSVRNGG